MLAEVRWNTDMIMAIGVFVGPVIGILGVLWYKATVATSENELKRSMVERGMSAEEIERVLKAGSKDART